MEKQGTKFGEDNFKHWKDTFTFKSMDEKNPGQYKVVKINMEDVMDRIGHYRKKYDEDDAFVRAVLDTHENVVKVMFTKDLAHLQEEVFPVGLAIILKKIRESRGEMEIWSVSRPANGNWFLVNGDFTQNELANMDLNKKEPKDKEKTKITKSEDDLKKKEELAINNIKLDEKLSFNDLPIKIKDKLKEKYGSGWTTEKPPLDFLKYHDVSNVNSVFNGKINIYKIIPSVNFFNYLIKNSGKINIKIGFCRSLLNAKNNFDLTERHKITVNHIISKCNIKYNNKLGLKNHLIDKKIT